MSTQSTPSSSSHSYLTEQEFSNRADAKSVWSHCLASTSVDGGLQAIISFEKHPVWPEHLGLPKLDDMTNLVFLQVTEPFQLFTKHVEAPPSKCLIVSLENYLHLYQFFFQHWSIICSKLVCNANQMIEGQEGLPIATNLYFFSNGSSHYKARLGKDLLVMASIQTKEASSNGASQPNLTVIIVKNDITLHLPLSTAIKLFSDMQAYNAIKQRGYKICHTKKHKPV